MKKKRKRMLSLLLVVAVLTTSNVTAFASEANDPANEAGNTETTETKDHTDTNPAAENSDNPDTSQNTESNNQTGNVQNTEVPPAAPIEGTIENQSGNDEQSSGGQNVQGSIIVDENNDDVEIKKNDRPYLSLGADLTDAQRTTVLSIMGIDPGNLSEYDVVSVSNAEEHQYLDAYISSSQIGSRSLSSVVIVEREKGSGLNISTNNITYCTVGMYKNALTTAGITDADIIVAGPSQISGTAALVGIFKAYQEMTGKTIGENVVDAALNELVITGQLEASLEGLTDQEVEEFIAYIKSVIAQNDLTDETGINGVIDEACEKYGVTLSNAERQQIVDLLLKITSLGIDLSGLVDYAESLYHSFKNGGGSGDGFLGTIGNFFTEVFEAISNFFKGLFS